MPVTHLDGPSVQVHILSKWLTVHVKTSLTQPLSMSTIPPHIHSVHIIYASSTQPSCLGLEKFLGIFQEPTEGLTLCLLWYIQHIGLL